MKRNTSFVGLLVILSVPSCLRAQTASIGGTITDATGTALPNAKVTAQNVDTGEARTAQTDEAGIYRIAAASRRESASTWPSRAIRSFLRTGKSEQPDA